MNQRLSLSRKSERRTGKRERDNPLVICIDKDEQTEMGQIYCQNNQERAKAEETTDSQVRNCSSPIMFPSQESGNELVGTQDEEDDCLEIVDRQEGLDAQEIEIPDDDHSSHSRAQTSKGKSRMSLGKKRQQVDVDYELNNDDKGKKPKQRQFICEEKSARVEQEEKADASLKIKESTTTEHPIMLRRKYKHKVCTTLEEADKMDQYFAPPGVDKAQYHKIILCKFEKSKQKIHIAQSRSPNFHPATNLLQPAPHVPQHHKTRVPRASVLIKNTKKVENLVDNNKVNNNTIDLVEISEKSAKDTECKSSIQVKPVQDIIEDDFEPHDHTTQMGNIIQPELAAASSNSASPSLIKPKLRNKLKRKIEESSSDEDLSTISFNLIKPEETPKVKHESVIFSSSVNAATTSAGREQEEHRQCPLCFKMFPEDKIENHASNCNGIYTRRSGRHMPVEEDADCDSERSDEYAQITGSSRTQTEMSPVVEVRTPTKVRELKLLSPNVAVRNLARELSPQTQQGEQVKMFGVNVRLSPKTVSVAKDTIKEKCVVSRKEEAKKVWKIKGDTIKTESKLKTSGSETESKLKTSESESASMIKDSKIQGGAACSSKVQGRVSKKCKYNQTQEDQDLIQKWLDDKNNGAKKYKELWISQHREMCTSTACTKTGSNVKKTCGSDSSNEDFIPLEYEDSEQEKGKSLPSTSSAMLISEDETEEEFLPCIRSKEKSLPSKRIVQQTSSATLIPSCGNEADEQFVSIGSKTDNDSDAVDLLVNCSKGKRIKEKNVVQETRRKRLKKSDENDGLELCGICNYYFPREIYAQHVNEEIAEKKKEKEELEIRTSYPSSHKPERKRYNLKSRIPRQGKRKQMLPDFAEDINED